LPSPEEAIPEIAFRSGNGPSIARARIYDAGGALVRTLTSGEYMPADGSFAWNGYDDRGRRAPIGIYVVVVDLVDGSGKEATALRAVVVLAGNL
jgi:flagellar hook assembly protein FlgD